MIGSTPRTVDEALELCADDDTYEAARADVVARLRRLVELADSVETLGDDALRDAASQAPKLSPGVGIEGWAYQAIYLPTKEWVDMCYQARNPAMADILAEDIPVQRQAFESARALLDKLAEGPDDGGF